MADLRGHEGRAPPGGPNSFKFMQFLENFGKIVCCLPHGELAPHLGEILDQPLVKYRKTEPSIASIFAQRVLPITHDGQTHQVH